MPSRGNYRCLRSGPSQRSAKLKKSLTIIIRKRPESTRNNKYPWPLHSCRHNSRRQVILQVRIFENAHVR